MKKIQLFQHVDEKVFHLLLIFLSSWDIKIPHYVTWCNDDDVGLFTSLIDFFFLFFFYSISLWQQQGIVSWLTDFLDSNNFYYVTNLIFLIFSFFCYERERWYTWKLSYFSLFLKRKRAKKKGNFFFLMKIQFFK